MTALIINLPESVFAATRSDPSHLQEEMRLTAAVSWYEAGRISQEIAALIAGMDRIDFLLALSRLGRPSFAVDFEELDRELARD